MNPWLKRWDFNKIVVSDSKCWYYNNWLFRRLIIVMWGSFLILNFSALEIKSKWTPTQKLIRTITFDATWCRHNSFLGMSKNHSAHCFYKDSRDAFQHRCWAEQIECIIYQLHIVSYHIILSSHTGLSIYVVVSVYVRCKYLVLWK